MYHRLIVLYTTFLTIVILVKIRSYQALFQKYVFGFGTFLVLPFKTAPLLIRDRFEKLQPRISKIDVLYPGF